MSGVVEDLVRRNRAHARNFAAADLSPAPSRALAVVTCMDARLDVLAALGLQVGEAHVIRNAGGIVTDDVLRSLVISQRLLGTREILVIAHTDCGMTTITEESLKARIEAETGASPPFSFEVFSDPDEAVRRSLARVRQSVFLPQRDSVRGFIYDVGTGLLREVAG